MDIAQRTPARTGQTQNQEVQLRSNAGNAAATAAARDTAGPIGQAAGNLGHAVHAEIQQSQNSATGRQPSKVLINESANQTFEIPSRKEILTDTLIEASFQVKQALEQHPEKFSKGDWKSASKLASRITSIKQKLQEDAPLSNVESRKIIKGVRKALEVAEDLTQIAKGEGSANATPTSRADVAARIPSRR